RGQNGTTTDARGNYELKGVPEGATLVFSFVGYKKKEVSYTGGDSLDVTMEHEEMSLEQVVVVGYGTEKRVNLTGAVEHIGEEVFKDRPMSNAAKGLEGAMPGIFVEMPTGSPTQDFSPLVRGEGSIGAGGSAVVLIDGIPGDVINLNPSVLKDVS